MTIMENLDETGTQTAKRPAFLTVLCILTFIGSGWGILSAFAQKDPGLEAYAGYYYWVSLLLSAGTLFGAIQMWQLKKMGLWIWTACEVISVVLMWVVMKGYVASLLSPAVDDAIAQGGNEELVNAAANLGAGMIEGVVNTTLMVGSGFAAVFVVLYWVNAKHLK